MDAATLQSRIYSGYAKAAQRIGYTADLYRPSSASNPLAAVNNLRELPASFNAEDMRYSKPSKYGQATRWGLFDGSLTRPGDYLVTAEDGTFFIAAQQSQLPPLMVECNRTADFKRPQQQAGVGAVGYGGNTAANETALMTQWPCSILQRSEGGKADSVLPGDVRAAWWLILVPHWAGVTLRSADIVTDELGRRYVISSAELSSMGWRITAQQAQT